MVIAMHMLLGVNTHVVFTEKENQFVISFFRYSTPKLQSLPLLSIQTRSNSLLTINLLVVDSDEIRFIVDPISKAFC